MSEEGVKRPSVRLSGDIHRTGSIPAHTFVKYQRFQRNITVTVIFTKFVDIC